MIIRNSTAEFLIFTSQEGKNQIEVRYENGTIWLTQKLIAELFSVSVPTINEHLKNIFESNELQKDSVIRKFLTTASDGKKYDTLFYNLDAIISVGYRVNSKRATQFPVGNPCFKRVCNYKVISWTRKGWKTVLFLEKITLNIYYYKNTALSRDHVTLHFRKITRLLNKKSLTYRLFTF